MGEGPRILIVDDDESIRKVLAAVLEENGYMIDAAEDGKKAIEKTDKNFYNMALVDIRLPDIEGSKLIAMMKETMPRMRKIIITGFPSLQNAVEALNKGADAYIIKPFDMDKVLQTVKEQLKKYEEEKKYSQERVTEFIETRVKELQEEKTITQKKQR
jgi:two-component system response regulator PilR (NtrC family)